ncbi:MAG TPA: DUF58 domain-containing protein [Nitrospiraceae bacterium]|nr:DUF58 domain-containing protein [Nitrospiraceae bacterium]
MPLLSFRTFFRWASRNRSIRLTSEGIRFVLLSVGIGVASLNTGNNLLYLLFAMMLSLIVISGILSERCFKQVQVSRRLPPALFANQAATAAFVIANRSSRLPVFSLRIMDLIEATAVNRGIYLLHLFPGASTTQSYPLLVKRRGPYVFEGIKLFTRFPFGLFVKAATFPLQEEVMVYPEIKNLSRVLFDDVSMVGHDQALIQRGQGTTLHNLRLYQPGDDSRAIHWKTTARKSLLIVRETEAEDQRHVTIVLHTHVCDVPDDSDSHALFERAVSLAASLAVLFTERMYEVRLVVGEQVLAYEIGEAHLARMLSLLAVCRPISETASQPTGPLQLSESYGNELTIHVLACLDPRATSTTYGASRVLLASEYMDL